MARTDWTAGALARCAAFVAAAVAVAAAASDQYAFYYTDAGYCDEHDCPGEILNFWLKRATFSADGSQAGKPANLTAPFYGMAYLDLSPDGSKMLFASEDFGTDGIVRTYLLDLANATAVANVLLTDALLAPLLKPCAPQCTSINTFHATWTKDGKSVVFAYRLWDNFGNGIGNQALGIVDIASLTVRGLTFTTAGAEQGLNIFDMCPAPVQGDPSRIFFVRSDNSGVYFVPTVVDLTTGNITSLGALPDYGDSSGCPFARLGTTGIEVNYMGCPSNSCDEARVVGMQSKLAKTYRSDAHAAWGFPPSWELSRSTAVSSKASMTDRNQDKYYYYYVSVQQTAGVSPSAWTYTTVFPVPLVNTTSYLDTYGITQCDSVRPTTDAANGTLLTCQGASKQHETFQMLFVNAATGNSSANSYDTMKACMGPRCALMAQVTAS